MSLTFSPHFKVICDLLLYRRTVTWNIFVSYDKGAKHGGRGEGGGEDDVIYASVRTNQNSRRIHLIQLVIISFILMT